MDRTEVLQGLWKMRFEKLLERWQRSDLSQAETGPEIAQNRELVHHDMGHDPASLLDSVGWLAERPCAASSLPNSAVVTGRASRFRISTIARFRSSIANLVNSAVHTPRALSYNYQWVIL